MISSLFKGLGRLVLFIASTAFITAVSLFVFGGFLLTWPILRLSPRDRKIKVMMDLAQSAMAALTVFSEGSVKKAMLEAMESDTSDEGLDPRPDDFDEEPETYVSDWRTP